MKYILSFALVLSLVGCGYVDREISGYTGKPSEVCVDGVTYLQFTSGTTAKVNLEGKPVACR